MHLKNIGFVKTQKYDTQLERNLNDTFLHLALGYACLNPNAKSLSFSISVEIKLNCRDLGIQVRHWRWNDVSCVDNINLKLQHLLYIWCHFIGRFNGDQYVCMHSRSGSVWPITILENNALIGQRRCDLHSMTGATQTMTPLEFRLSR